MKGEREEEKTRLEEKNGTRGKACSEGKLKTVSPSSPSDRVCVAGKAITSG